jgi:urea transport system permease protein
MLLPLLDRATEPDDEVRRAAADTLKTVEARLARAQLAGLVFSGLSLGSILLLAALGLAITYGLMGVINMAHGELIMIGAYTTYVVQNLSARTCPAPSMPTCWWRCRRRSSWPGWWAWRSKGA